MNTITKSAILESDRLATLYAGELRGKGWTPTQSPAVTSEKTLRLEFQNGRLYTITLPVARVAAWARLSPMEEIGVEFSAGSGPRAPLSMTLRAGASVATFVDQSPAADDISGGAIKARDALADVPPIRFDDGPHGPDYRGEFKFIAPPETGDLTARLKSQKAARQLARLRQKETAAKRALKSGAARFIVQMDICGAANTAAGLVFALPAYDSAVTRARHYLRAARMLRRSLQTATTAPASIIPWLGETVEPAGEYDAGPIHRFTPEHAGHIAAIESAIKARADFHAKRPANVGGPKSTALQTQIDAARAKLFDYVCAAHRAELEKNGLDPFFAYTNRDSGKLCLSNHGAREYSRARLAVRAWAGQKWQLAQDYTLALNARRKFEAKQSAPGNVPARHDETPAETVSGVEMDLAAARKLPFVKIVNQSGETIKESQGPAKVIFTMAPTDAGPKPAAKPYSVNGVEFDSFAEANEHAKTASLTFGDSEFKVLCNNSIGAIWYQGKLGIGKPATSPRFEGASKSILPVEIAPEVETPVAIKPAMKPQIAAIAAGADKFANLNDSMTATEAANHVQPLPVELPEPEKPFAVAPAAAIIASADNAATACAEWREWSDKIWHALHAQFGPHNIGLCHLEQVMLRSAAEKRCAQCGDAGAVPQKSILIASIKTYWLCADCAEHYQSKAA